ncbi:MAG: hypothetical protein JNN07_02265 [Verrucomicrobiales bacterium]|nr:hypothetical protein [Verrucomicrobiales bacterium]
MSAPSDSPTPPNNSSDAPNQASAATDSGRPLELLERFPLSASVRGVLASVRQTARNEDFRGLIGTGMMLICLERAGNRVVKSGEVYAPNVLSRLLNEMNGARFTAARKHFFDRNRRAPNDAPQTATHASHSLLGVFEQAMQLPRHDDILAARHLITALLMYRPNGRVKPTSAWEILDDAGIDREILLAEFLNSLAEGGPLAEREKWRRLAAEHTSRIAAGAPTREKKQGESLPQGPYMPGYGSDNPSGKPGDDCLNLESTVNALAHLIASPQLDGNLSLGVFGNWGSGKSFFMRRLRGAIGKLTDGARALAKQNPTGASACWPNVVQVEFNAWHYIDANLWASLMSHLLSDLRSWEPEVSTTASTPLRRALDKLCIATEMRDEAVRRESEARQAKDSAETLLQNTRIQQDTAVQNLARLASRSLWSFIENNEGFAPLRKQVIRQLQELGFELEETTGNVESIYGQLQELGTTAGVLQAVARRLVHARDAARQLSLVLVIVLAPLLLLLVLSFTPAGDFFRQTGVWLGTSMAGLLAAGVNGIRWVHGRASEVLAALAPLGAARRRIESGLAAADSEKARLISLGEQKVAEAQAAVDAAKAGLAEKEKELRGAMAEVNDALSGRAITRFIEQRLASGDYQKHLGLIALIRRDFEHLSELVRAHNAQRLGLDREVLKVQEALLKARPEITPGDAAAFFAHLGINRIVLYIDDLDRCPSNRVVEVLQAIHLLLSFDVFVVVVGVDSRWMAHSLAKEYPALLARTKEEDDKDRVWSREVGISPVTPSDYLEKIFQIPLWVPPLDADAAKVLIGKLTSGSDSAGSSASAVQPSVRENQNVSDLSNRGESASNVIANDSEDSYSDQRPVAGALSSANPNQGPESRIAEPTTALAPVLLVLGSAEREAMASLALIIGRSPRATKRFVNSYRLFRAALTDRERTAFGDQSDGLGGLAAPMLLLSIVTGAPALAGQLLTGLSLGQSGTVLEALHVMMGQTDFTEVAPETLRRLQEFEATEDAKRWQAVPLSRASMWASRIAQFSFEDLSRKELSRSSPLPPASEG